MIAAAAGVRASDAAVKAAHSERLPNIALRADAGVAGTAPTQTSLGVYTVQGVVTIPVYNGGRIAGDEKQAEAAQHQRRAEFEDTRAQVDQDVRQALIQLSAANSQVHLATRNQVLAHESLTQSDDRFAAGVTDTIEVVQAEQAVVQADDDQIIALFHTTWQSFLSRGPWAPRKKHCHNCSGNSPCPTNLTPRLSGPCRTATQIPVARAA